MTSAIYVDEAEGQHYVVQWGGGWWTVEGKHGAWSGRRRRTDGPSGDSHRVDPLAERALLRFLAVPTTCPAGHPGGSTMARCVTCQREKDRARYPRRKVGA